MPSVNTALDGPDFLEAVADQEAANSNPVNATEFRNRAQQWREDKAARESAETTLSELKAQLENARQALQAAA